MLGETIFFISKRPCEKPPPPPKIFFGGGESNPATMRFSVCLIAKCPQHKLISSLMSLKINGLFN
jgi:hypothetical protein